ncbi:dihydrofolate reductase family protein [Enemella evansiae]|uniref:dihydrofolate reductase family protein n=1 Tax=Enemella evansiae TaxID=2016499 RepID=UPI000B960FC6|nr:dihydrofolate reductase family protein [Enemella evansiae]OYO13029.1 hypothetical protein BI335_14040 [Enemella evansiae]TDO94237.1 riboflavin biosynthesis pyrimidine reductase [Enemella evansiae]
MAIDLRTLMGPAGLPADLDESGLAEAYAWQEGVRALMLTTMDGVVTGSDGRSGSLGTPADRAVFELNRRLADAIVVGAGTARTEDYGLPEDGQLLVVVSRRGELPVRLRTEAAEVAEPRLVLAVGDEADTAAAEELLGAERIWRCPGRSGVDPRMLHRRLRDAGHQRIQHEGGPGLLTGWLAAGLIDELCLTQVPRLAGAGVRLISGPVGEASWSPVLLLAEDGALIGRWRPQRGDSTPGHG